MLIVQHLGWIIFICSYELHVNMVDMQILDKTPSSDHLPVCANFNLDCIKCDSDSCDDAKNNSNIPVANFQWTKPTDVDKYNSSTHINLKTINIPDAIFCKAIDCKLDHHISDIDVYYSSILMVMNQNQLSAYFGNLFYFLASQS